MIRKDLHVQTEQITLCVSRFLQTDDSDQSATQITSADVQENQPETMQSIVSINDLILKTGIKLFGKICTFRLNKYHCLFPSNR
jgi:hypothetical protein